MKTNCENKYTDRQTQAKTLSYHPILSGMQAPGMQAPKDTRVFDILDTVRYCLMAVKVCYFHLIHEITNIKDRNYIQQSRAIACQFIFC